MGRWLLTLVLLCLSVTGAVAAPGLSVERLNFDFGEVVQGAKVEHVFRFRNTGDQVLVVGNVRSSCGCTAALLTATRIAPGDTGELRATFDSTRFKGAIHKVISIDANDPDQPQVSFALSGNVKTELLLQPERVSWGKVKASEPLTETVKITNQGKTTITLAAPQVTNPAISAELSALRLAPGDQVELQLSAKFPEQTKRIGGYVIIATDYPNVPQLRVSVSARLSE